MNNLRTKKVHVKLKTQPIPVKSKKQFIAFKKEGKLAFTEQPKAVNTVFVSVTRQQLELHCAKS